MKLVVNLLFITIRAALAATSLAICSLQLHRCNVWSPGVLSCVGWEVTASQLDLPSLTPLFVAGCGRLQLGAPHWATSEDYCK